MPLNARQGTLTDSSPCNADLIPDVYATTILTFSLSFVFFPQYLSLRGNQLTGTIPATLGLAPDVSTLDLSANGITGAIPNNLGHPKTLRFMYLGFNQLTGRMPLGLAATVAAGVRVGRVHQPATIAECPVWRMV